MCRHTVADDDLTAAAAEPFDTDPHSTCIVGSSRMDEDLPEGVQGDNAMSRSQNKILRVTLEETLAELRAINLWNRIYALQETPNAIEAIAWEMRRRRVSELTRAFLETFVAPLEDADGS